VYDFNLKGDIYQKNFGVEGVSTSYMHLEQMSHQETASTPPEEKWSGNKPNMMY